MALQTFDRHEVGSKYHVEAPTPKHVENSIRGSTWAKRHGFRTTDLDMLPDAVLTQAVHLGKPITPAVCKGHVRNTHWPECIRHDGFRDPKGILHRDDHVQQMYPHELDRLVAGHRPRLYHIPTIEAQIAHCGAIHLQALLEPKHSMVWMRPEVWVYLAAVCDAYNTRTAVYSLMHECLPYARHAGFNAWAI